MVFNHIKIGIGRAVSRAVYVVLKNRDFRSILALDERGTFERMVSSLADSRRGNDCALRLMQECRQDAQLLRTQLSETAREREQLQSQLDALLIEIEHLKARRTSGQ